MAKARKNDIAILPLLVWARTLAALSYGLPGRARVPLDICDTCGHIARRVQSTPAMCTRSEHGPMRAARADDVARGYCMGDDSCEQPAEPVSLTQQQVDGAHVVLACAAAHRTKDARV